MKKNRQIIVTVGVPASGKSTWAKNFVAENPSFVKIERDDFRYGMKNISIGDKRFENFITELQYKAIHTALNNKYNVIVSDTNCNLKYLKILLKEFKYKADIQLKFFQTDLELCISRDSYRERSVGKNVINKMWEGCQEVVNEYMKEYSNQEILFSRKEFIYSPTPFDDSLENCIIVDLDGTLAHANGKRGYYEWSKVGLDDVDESIADIIMKYNNEHIIFLTGRSEDCRFETLDWISSIFGVGNVTLLMRNSKDFRPSTIVKKELYENFIKDKFNTIFAIEDKTDISKMWRSLGIKTLQCMSDD